MGSLSGVFCHEHGTTGLPVMGPSGVSCRVCCSLSLLDAFRSVDLEVGALAFREVGVTEIREVLRAWLAGAGLRRAAEQAGVDRKTARRYVEAAVVAAGLARDGGAGQLTDELVGQVAQAVRPARPGGHGLAWGQLEACHAGIQAWVKKDLTVVKIGVLLERRGVVVPYRTRHR